MHNQGHLISIEVTFKLIEMQLWMIYYHKLYQLFESLVKCFRTKNVFETLPLVLQKVLLLVCLLVVEIIPA